MLLTLVLLPVVAGLTVWAAGDRRRTALRVVSVGSLAVTLGVAVAAAAGQPTASLRWGAGLSLRLEVAQLSRGAVVLVAFVGLAVVVYALGYGGDEGRARMVGLLVAFVGAMGLLLVAADFLTLLIGWELVGLVSWGLIAHHWRSDAPSQATQAFLTTRAGDLGLFVAAGAAFAATGSLDFDALSAADGALAAVVAAGVLVAAVAKSAQVPFSPWLFSAMAGPTPASALLHSATMVAAGAYLLVRLQPFLDRITWFGPLAITIGLLTAVAGGAVAVVQPEAKKLLAASTSAQYGFMVVAVGAGFPAIAVVHLIAHGLFKSLLFIAAGEAIDASGSEDLAGMRLGRRLPMVAGLTLVGALALAAIPPLGAAWTKEEIVAAAGHTAPWLAVAVIAAGALSALYAARFQLLAFGRPEPSTTTAGAQRGAGQAQLALGLLAAASVVLGVLWTPWGEERLRSLTGGEVPAGADWELAGSLAAVAAAAAGAVVLDRRGRLAAPLPAPARRWAASWFGLPAVASTAVVHPTLALAGMAARFDDRVVDRGIVGAAALARWMSLRAATGDDRVVDAGIRGVAGLGARFARVLDRVSEGGIDGAVVGVARLTGAAGRDGRRLQSGQTHRYYAGVAVGVAVLTAVTAAWR